MTAATLDTPALPASGPSNPPATGTDGIRHGTYSGYTTDGCRCLDCCTAATDYNRNRRRQIAYGRWNPRTGPDGLRAHLAMLAGHDISPTRAAALAGVSRNTVGKVMRTPPEPISAKSAAKILAVRPSPGAVTRGTRIDATGTRRMLQALAARGFPGVYLAEQLGVIPNTATRLLRQPFVEASTAQAVTALYRRLHNSDPAAAGVPARDAERTSARAARLGWAPPGCWDEDTIGDPAAFPEWTGACGTPRGRNLHYSHRILPVCPPCAEAHAAERKGRAA